MNRRYCHLTILQLARQGLTDLQVAFIVGCSRTNVSRIRRNQRIRLNARNRHWFPEEVELLHRLLIDGDRRTDIALFLNRPLQSIKKKVIYEGWAGKYDYVHNRVRLYDLVWLMWERGYNRRSIARRLHLSYHNVCKIITRRPSVFR